MSDQRQGSAWWKRAAPLGAIAIVVLVIAGVAAVVLRDDDSPSTDAATSEPSTTTTTTTADASTTTTTADAEAPLELPSGAREAGRYKGTAGIPATPEFNVGSRWAVQARVTGPGIVVEVFRPRDDPLTAEPVQTLRLDDGDTTTEISTDGRFFLRITSSGATYEVIAIDLPG